jgi:ribosomal protein L11 methyltransferase
MASEPSQTPPSRRSRAAFVRLELRAEGAALAERAAAEAYAAGALGLEEREEGASILLLVYAREEAAPELARALAQVPGLAVGPAQALPDRDWSEAWKAGLEAVDVSPRLRVRPSFVTLPPAPGQAELVIDPGQAFGTGGHASTRLALEWVDALAPALASAPGARVLDVGCGTGVLALAALRLGAPRAVAFDVDPLAAAAARANARSNGLAARLEVFTGPLGALADVRFELVLANLLRSELLPLAADLAARTAPRGQLVLSGLLEAERDAVVASFAPRGLHPRGERSRGDAAGDVWLALLMAR